MIPQIAIVGRPNVGKSSLFNWIIGERISIVDSVAGVTRDRVTRLLDLEPETKTVRRPLSKREEKRLSDSANDGKPNITKIVEFVDTGGFGIVDVDDLSEDVEMQIRLAISSACLILFVVDVQEGLTAFDSIVAERLRKLSCPILLVVNKADNESDERNTHEFQALGWGVISVSAKQKRGRVALMQEIEQALSENDLFTDTSDSDQEPVMKVAIVGRRNVGKSTFINTLTKEERVIASPIPGTTRDIIDVRFEMDGKTFVAVDTPGFQRKKGVKTDLEFYSSTRAERAIRMADVVLMFFDCTVQVGKVEKQLVSLIEEQMKPCIFVVNKWDKLTDVMATERWADYLREQFPSLAYAPIAFVTGKSGRNCKKMLNHAQMLFKQSRQRIATARLNKWVTKALDYNPPPLRFHHKAKVYYATQADIQPPTIVLFCNMEEAFSKQYERYLLTTLRDELPFADVPIKIIFRKRDSGDNANEIEVKRKS
ncbi:MAG: ribosome biogenesis GTPase Der [Planctomycetaceae bacterium]|jgi:GTP-binding protein|nr:ribosome biogenesis GTPase Der [Planctomycetaceae bacterium]